MTENAKYFPAATVPAGIAETYGISGARASAGFAAPRTALKLCGEETEFRQEALRLSRESPKGNRVRQREARPRETGNSEGLNVAAAGACMMICRETGPEKQAEGRKGGRQLPAPSGYGQSGDDIIRGLANQVSRMFASTEGNGGEQRYHAGKEHGRWLSVK